MSKRSGALCTSTRWVRSWPDWCEVLIVVVVAFGLFVYGSFGRAIGGSMKDASKEARGVVVQEILCGGIAILMIRVFVPLLSTNPGRLTFNATARRGGDCSAR